MTQSQFIAQLGGLLSKLSDTLTKKGKDYSPEQDVFGNFKFAANTANITVDESILNLIGIKVARISNLMPKGMGQVPNFESIEDSILDLMGYSALLYLSMVEYKSLLDELNDDITPPEIKKVTLGELEDRGNRGLPLPSIKPQVGGLKI